MRLRNYKSWVVRSLLFPTFVRLEIAFSSLPFPWFPRREGPFRRIMFSSIVRTSRLGCLCSTEQTNCSRANKQVNDQLRIELVGVKECQVTCTSNSHTPLWRADWPLSNFVSGGIALVEFCICPDSCVTWYVIYTRHVSARISERIRLTSRLDWSVDCRLWTAGDCMREKITIDRCNYNTNCIITYSCKYTAMFQLWSHDGTKWMIIWWRSPDSVSHWLTAASSRIMGLVVLQKHRNFLCKFE